MNSNLNTIGTESGPSPKRMKTDNSERMPEVCTSVGARTMNGITFATLYLESKLARTRL